MLPLEALHHLPGAVNVIQENHRLRVLTRTSEEILPHLIAVCLEHGVRIRSVEISKPNLETVFLKLTGRALRD